MIGTPHFAEVAALIGDPARANMLLALKDDGVLTAAELAHVAGVAPNTASGHLAKLLAAGMIMVERQGRHRYYRLAGNCVADALEMLAALATNALPRIPSRTPRDDSPLFARSCYDHLAGNLGVKLTWSLVDFGHLTSTDKGFALSRNGEAALVKFGIDLARVRSSRRPLARQCLDWSERQPHLGGALGASLFTRLRDLGWLRREIGKRAVFVTHRGRQGFREHFQIEV